MDKEFISHEAGHYESWICICGNKPTSAGFSPCDEGGQEIEPASNWKNLYVCDSCGRIVRQDTLEVLGKVEIVCSATVASLNLDLPPKADPDEFFRAAIDHALETGAIGVWTDGVTFEVKARLVPRPKQ